MVEILKLFKEDYHPSPNTSLPQLYQHKCSWDASYTLGTLYETIRKTARPCADDIGLEVFLRSVTLLTCLNEHLITAI